VQALGWIVAALLVVGLLGVDLFVFHKKARKDTPKQAILWSVFWVVIGLAFAAFVGLIKGREGVLQYLTGFLIEKSLSVDNLFVFLAIFAYFAVPEDYQHRVLFWGIIGAVVSRGLFIFGGVALISRFHVMLYVLGALLVITGVRLVFSSEEVHPEKNRVVRLARRLLPIEPQYHGERLVVHTAQGWRFTPLMLALLAIESADVMFAIDSVPAVLAVSQDPFVVYTSNIFAILGLRALYFVLAGALTKLRFLKWALAVILVLVGVKMLIVDMYKVPTLLSLAAVAVILGVAVTLSLLFPKPGPSAKALVETIPKCTLVLPVVQVGMVGDQGPHSVTANEGAEGNVAGGNADHEREGTSGTSDSQDARRV